MDSRLRGNDISIWNDVSYLRALFRYLINARQAAERKRFNYFEENELL
ncbi:hypothetical protein ACQUW5_04210 [Legionella sp. CNM-1927-20]